MRGRRAGLLLLLLPLQLLTGCAPAIHTWTAAATQRTPTPLPSPAPTPTPTPTPAPTPRTAATPVPDPPPATADPPGGVTAVGDSVMLGASSALRHAIPSIEVDAVVSRQWDAGVATVGADRDSGRLRPTLVVDLGTNGTVSAAQSGRMKCTSASIHATCSQSLGNRAIIKLSKFSLCHISQPVRSCRCRGWFASVTSNGRAPKAHSTV